MEAYDAFYDYMAMRTWPMTRIRHRCFKSYDEIDSKTLEYLHLVKMTRTNFVTTVPSVVCWDDE